MIGWALLPIRLPSTWLWDSEGLHLCPGSATGSWYKVGQEIKVSELRISSSVQ